MANLPPGTPVPLTDRLSRAIAQHHGWDQSLLMKREEGFYRLYVRADGERDWRFIVTISTPTQQDPL